MQVKLETKQACRENSHTQPYIDNYFKQEETYAYMHATSISYKMLPTLLSSWKKTLCPKTAQPDRGCGSPTNEKTLYFDLSASSNRLFGYCSPSQCPLFPYKLKFLAWPLGLPRSALVHWRRQWQPTPVFLPGESQGRGSLVGCRLWGCTESDTTEAT